MEEENGFDEIFNYIGGMGLYQVFLLFICAAGALTSVDMYYINFVGLDMEHWCHVPELSGLPYHLQKEIALPIEKTGEYSRCEHFNLNYSSYSKEDFLSWNRTADLPEDVKVKRCQSWVYDQSEIVSSIVSKYDLVCGGGWKVSFVSTMAIFGILVGIMPIGMAADRYGRKKTIMVTLLLKTIAGFGCAFSPNYVIFILFSTLLGAMSMGFYTTIYVLYLEFVGSAHRGMCGLLLSSVNASGFMLLAWIGYSVRHVELIQIVMAAPQILLVLYIWIIPESPRWLIVKKKYKEAAKLVKFVADVNRHELPADFEISKFRSSFESGSANPLDIFRSRTLLRQTFILFIHWFTVSLLFWAMTVNIDSLGSNLYITTVLMASMDMVSNWLGGFLLGWKRLGRKLTSSLSLVVGGFSCLVCVPLIILNAPLDAITGLSLIGKAGSTIGFSAIYIYTAEIMPTDVRNVGLSICSIVARISGMLAPFVGGPLRDVWQPLPSLIFGVLGLLAGAVVLLLPETLNKPLFDSVAHLEASQKMKGSLDTQVELVDFSRLSVGQKDRDDMERNDEASTEGYTNQGLSYRF